MPKKLSLLLLIVLFIQPSLADHKKPVIGSLLSLTGFGTLQGKVESQGISLARKNIPQLSDDQITFTSEDFQSDLRKTASSLISLIDVKKATVVIGPNWAEFLSVAAPIAAKKQIPLISASGYSEDAFTPDGCALSLFPPPALWVENLAKSIGARKVVSFTTSIQYFQTLNDSLKAALPRYGGEVVETFFSDPSEQRFTPSLLRTKKMPQIEGVVNLLLEGSFSSLLRQAKELQLSLPIFGANQFKHDTVLLQEPALAEGLTFFDYVTHGSANFKSQYQTAFSEAPHDGSALAYDAAHLAALFLEKCSDHPSPCTCAKSLTLQGETGEIRFDATGKRLTFPEQITEIFVVKNGVPARE